MEISISILALGVSIIAIIISCRESYLTGRPYLNLAKIEFDPKEFKCYSDKDIEGYEKISEDNKRIIRDTRKQVIMKRIDNRDYLLVNFLEKGADVENIRLILAPMICKYRNTGGQINEITMIKGTTEMKNDNGRVIKYKASGKIIPEDDSWIEMSVAYVLTEGQGTSLLYDKLENEKEGFDYLKDKNKASEIINFKRDSVVVKCKNNRKKQYRFRITLEMNRDNELSVNIE